MQIPKVVAALLAYWVMAAYASESSLGVGLLYGADCYDADPKVELMPENQRYWYRRIAPYVGYARGEKSLAGGDGSCIVGYPKVSEGYALIMVDGKKVKLFPVPSENGGPARLTSEDGILSVEILEVGSETTCAPDSESCCGDYTYAEIQVSKGRMSNKIEAVNYSGS